MNKRGSYGNRSKCGVEAAFDRTVSAAAPVRDDVGKEEAGSTRALETVYASD
jgi:hypothetical protein